MTDTIASRIRAAAGALAVLAAALAATPSAALAAGDGPSIERQSWSFGGVLGRFRQEELQRGFQIYNEVCSTCHSLKRLNFRNLSEPGGPGFPEDRVKALAAKSKVDNVPDDKGKVNKRPALPSDPIPGPYLNEQQARYANNGALPPDLSLIIRARSVEYHGPWWLHPFAMLRDIANGYQEGGADYVYAVLTGYGPVPKYVRNATGQLVPLPKDQAEPAGAEACASITAGEAGKADECTKMSQGMHYNAAFPSHQIAMAMPGIGESGPRYPQGVPRTVDQQARDVVAFLAWAADPHHDARKRMGVLVMIYLLITTVLLYLAKRKLWASLH